MVFSSLLFTFLFLPIVLLIYYVSPHKVRNYVLLIASILFYAYGEPRFVFIMLSTILINYATALGIVKSESKGIKKGLLILSVVIDLGVLFIFKYLHFVGDILFSSNNPFIHFALPIGISFYTFQILSYVIDVYRGKVEAQKNPFYLALYISFFPQLIAGPIVRYIDIEKQINHDRHMNFTTFGFGALRFTQGFLKKVLIANHVSVIAEEVFLNYTGSNTLVYWVGALAYALEIYFDFSGYSDMAIGLGRMFGIHFLENFNYPYMASSITDFWRRWHISLSSWFKDYVYIPLGGSFVTPMRHIFNLFVVWALTGIWHGANYTFIVWGLLYFVMLVIEKYVVKIEERNLMIRILYRFFTLLYVLLLWVIFNSPSISFAFDYIGKMFLFSGIDMNEVLELLKKDGLWMVLGFLFVSDYPKRLYMYLSSYEWFDKATIVVMPLVCICLFLWAVSYLVVGTHNPFIYFNF